MPTYYGCKEYNPPITEIRDAWKWLKITTEAISPLCANEAFNNGQTSLQVVKNKFACPSRAHKQNELTFDTWHDATASPMLVCIKRMIRVKKLVPNFDKPIFCTNPVCIECMEREAQGKKRIAHGQYETTESFVEEESVEEVPAKTGFCCFEFKDDAITYGAQNYSDDSYLLLKVRVNEISFSLRQNRSQSYSWEQNGFWMAGKLLIPWNAETEEVFKTKQQQFVESFEASYGRLL